MENSTIFAANQSLSDTAYNSSGSNLTAMGDAHGNVISNVIGMVTLQYTDIGLLILNVGAIISFLLDKVFAQNGLWRVRNLNLLLCCVNSPLSALPSMFLFRHKINHLRFYIFVIIGFVLMFKCEFLHEPGSWLMVLWKMFGYFNFAFIIFSLLNHYSSSDYSRV